MSAGVDTESASNHTTRQWKGGVKVLTLCQKTVASYLGLLPIVVAGALRHMIVPS
jgi:hypothetical protein